MCNDFDAPIGEVGDGNVVAEVAGAAVNLDALLKEGGEGGWVEDAVLGWLGGVDDELDTPGSAGPIEDLKCGFGYTPSS